MNSVKIILMVTWFGINFSLCQKSDEDIFMVGNKRCITNGSAALAIIKTIRYTDKNDDNKLSSFYPTSEETYSCSFDDPNGCAKKDCWTADWYLITATDGPINHYVTDRRWEAFRTYKSPKYDSVLLTRHPKSFNIPLSVRIKKDGYVQIRLCDDQYNCYCISLKGMQFEILKCKNTLASSDSILAHQQPKGKFEDFSEDVWTHLKIVREDNLIEVLRGNDVIGAYTDNDIPIYETKLVTINTKESSLWKVHDYRYLFSDESTEESIPIGPQIKISKTTTCISMFVAMCKTCCLTLKFFVGDEEIHEENINQIEMWTEKKLIIDTRKYEGKTLILTDYKHHCGGNSKEGQFWAIDEFRLCEEIEYRYIKSDNKEFTCQKLGTEQNEILKLENNNEINERGVDCPDDTFGKFCVPCYMFGNNYCDDFVYCDMDHLGQNCHCTAGSTGPKCAKECPDEFYGHGCLNRCSEHCSRNCTRALGYCLNKCEEPYRGFRCEESKVVYFVNSPVVSDFTPISVKVRVENFTVEAPANTKSPPIYYNIEYVEVPDQNMHRTGKSQIPSEWKNNLNNLKFGKDKEITINDLMPDTRYRVRAYITGEEKGDYIKFASFNTTCTDLSEDDVTVYTTNVSATIEIKWHKTSCRQRRYQLLCNNIMLKNDLSKSIKLPKLEPYTEYNCTIKDIISGKDVVKKFSTKEGVPSVVRNVTNTVKDNSILLSWKEPEKKRGKIINYTIEYYYLNSKGASCTLNTRRFNESTPETTINLKNLNFYSVYNIKIYAVTNGGQGEVFMLNNIETSQSDDFSGDEKLIIDSHKAYSENVTIYVSKIDCEDLRGPIHLRAKASCSNEWCPEKNMYKTVDYSPNSRSITLIKLFPYSNYTVYVSISRDKKSWNFIGLEKFQTSTTFPNRISELEVISKDEKSISLRWKPPYPPTGVLTQYVIQYSYYYYNYQRKSPTTVDPEYVSPQSCPLWKDYHCGNLTRKIYKDYTYSIWILARNEKPEEFGYNSKPIIVKIMEEASQPTYDISLLWDEKNNLSITWYHPNCTNGALKSFEINLEDTKSKSWTIQQDFFKVKNDNNYNLTYTKTVAYDRLQACTEYRALIRVHNVYKASYAAYASATSPPDLPPNIPIENLHTERTNTTITVHVSNVESIPTKIYDQRIYILVSKAAETDDLVLFEESLKRMDDNPTMKTSRIVYNSTRSNPTLDFVIGDNNRFESSLENPPLEPGTNYSVSVFLSNECSDVMRLSRAQKYIRTLEVMGEIDENTSGLPGAEGGNGGLWALILLLLVPLIGFGYWYKKTQYKKESDMLIPHDSIKRENIALPRLPNHAGKVVSVKPKRSLPQFLPPLITTHSKPIRISDFEKYVKDVVTSGELEMQHNLFPRGLVKPCEYGSMAENKVKNRYKNLIAYDDTRVKLQKIRGDEYSDYINANYIDGYRKPRCYIATQGPKSNTLADFWRMIWQEKVRHIVMLANVYENGKKKVEKYWPDINEDLTFGNVRVQHVSSDIFANFDIRVFTVHCNDEERKINQLHFTTWPDHGVPLYSQSLVPFLQRVLKIPYNPQSPIVVHCSAGVGRTGTIILSDICLRMAAGEGSIDFLAHLENIRSQRANLVDNIEQYKLAHLVVLECLFGLHTAVPCNKEMKKIVDGILMDYGIQKQMKYIIETQWQDSAMETMLEHEDDIPSYPEKNRFKKIIPRHYRVFLTKYPADDDSSFYINAVQVDGFRNPGRFISTPQPMPNTLGDFWRLVVERSCTTIISLNTLNLKDKTVCKFWPGNGEELNPLDIITVQHIKTKRLECYKVITVQVKFAREGPFTVDILEIDNWRSDELLPNSMEEFLAFLDAAEAISRNSEHVIVTCYDGATASGLYLAMTFLIEKMKLEQECDVCLAVRTIRHSRKEFVTKEEQYEFLYRASVTFIAGFQSYANFT